MRRVHGVLEAGSSSPVPDLTADARTTAVLAVLAGVAPDAVARRSEVPRVVLDRWVATFVEGGRTGLALGAAAAEAPDAHRDRYLGLVSHELRSPLAMIQGWADVLGAAEDDPEVRAHALRSIQTHVQRLRRLADDALDASAMALGALRMDVVPADLADSVTAVVAARSAAMPPVDADDHVRVLLDHHRFGQILDNLLDNVGKHGSGLTSIEVRRRGAFGEVVITSAGDPIPTEVAQRMFQPFERGETAAEGVGLGLYICRSLVMAHGGRIGLRVDDRGNHFWLRLPVADADAEVVVATA